uniref:AlNc14C5G800 protein n=1 Tax=Albugo laibachii Nc14 TaxID=890382 RepID=F0W121_9STRA|nr:AlNc14C5G800 [Albugo laibachii Nc14]|eukprot:CCA14745.1 AlNc14C5G800 [Albugo laibachii Nc14]
MDGTIVTTAFVAPFFAYQIRTFRFAFSSQHVDEVFGFTTTKHKDCISEHATLTKCKDGNVNVKFENLVAEIKKMFAEYERDDDQKLEWDHRKAPPQEFINRLGALIVSWDKILFDYMDATTRRVKCDYVLTTLRYRLLYQMSLEKREKFMTELLQQNPRTPGYDEYEYQNKCRVRIRTNTPLLYEEQRALIQKSKEFKVTPFVISATANPYLYALNNHFKLKIEWKHMNGSYPIGLRHFMNSKALDDDILAGNGHANSGVEELQTMNLEALDKDVLAGNGHASSSLGKLETMNDIIQRECCQAVFVARNSMSDLYMLAGVLEMRGFALIQQDAGNDGDLFELKKRCKDLAHIQFFNSIKAIWTAEPIITSSA